MLFDIMNDSSAANIIITVFSYLVIFIICFPVHESAHALTAKWLGDETGANMGRISLNPLAHLDPMGTLSMLIFGIGWAKPVPVSPYRCRKVKSQKTAMALTAAAGPVSNVLIALVFMIIAKIILRTALNGGAADMTLTYVIMALRMIIDINLSLGVFNLLPIPPFDGSRLFLAFLPTKYYFGIMKYERYIMIAIMILLWTGILQIPLAYLSGFIYKGLDLITSFIA